MDYLINIITTILSVIVGGLITMNIGKREIRDNTKISIYLEFLNIIEGRYDNDKTDDYLKVLRKVMLIANEEVMDTLEKYNFIPGTSDDWLKNKVSSSNALGDIICSMRKDIGLRGIQLKDKELAIYYLKE